MKNAEKVTLWPHNKHIIIYLRHRKSYIIVLRLISLCDVCQQQREESCCYQHDGFGDLHCLNIIRKYLEVRKYHQAPAKLEASNWYLPSGRNNAHRNLPLSGPLSTTDIFHTRNKKKKFSIFFLEFD